MFFFNDTATTEIYTYCHTLSLHDALPIYFRPEGAFDGVEAIASSPIEVGGRTLKIGDIAQVRRGYEEPPSFRIFNDRSDEHTSELQSLMRHSYAVFSLKKQKTFKTHLNKQSLSPLQHNNLHLLYLQ